MTRSIFCLFVIQAFLFSLPLLADDGVVASLVSIDVPTPVAGEGAEVRMASIGGRNFFFSSAMRLMKLSVLNNGDKTLSLDTQNPAAGLAAVYDWRKVVLLYNSSKKKEWSMKDIGLFSLSAAVLYAFILGKIEFNKERFGRGGSDVLGFFFTIMATLIIRSLFDKYAGKPSPEEFTTLCKKFFSQNSKVLIQPGESYELLFFAEPEPSEDFSLNYEIV